MHICDWQCLFCRVNTILYRFGSLRVQGAMMHGGLLGRLDWASGSFCRCRRRFFILRLLLYWNLGRNCLLIRYHYPPLLQKKSLHRSLSSGWASSASSSAIASASNGSPSSQSRNPVKSGDLVTQCRRCSFLSIRLSSLSVSSES